MIIASKKIKLRPAQPSDRKKIFLWLTQSDVTPFMMGLPLYPDLPIQPGRNSAMTISHIFLILPARARKRLYYYANGNEEVGTIRYDTLVNKKGGVVLDIWMRATKYCGFGFGGDASIPFVIIYMKDMASPILS